MRKRYVQVKTDEGYELVEIGKAQPTPRTDAPYVMGDIEPYRPVAGPEAEAWVRGDKDRKLIGGRKQHREYLRRNGFEEIGNEKEAFLKYAGKTRENYQYYGRDGAQGGWAQADLRRLNK